MCWMCKICSSVAQISAKFWQGATASVGRDFPIADDALIGPQQPDIAATPQRAVMPTERSDEGSAFAFRNFRVVDHPSGKGALAHGTQYLRALLLPHCGRVQPGAPSIRSLIADGWESTDPNKPLSSRQSAATRDPHLRFGTSGLSTTRPEKAF